MSLTQTAVTDPYLQDNDAIEGMGTAARAGALDVSNWRLIRARRDGGS
jgi:hypothetical protein